MAGRHRLGSGRRRWPVCPTAWPRCAWSLPVTVSQRRVEGAALLSPQLDDLEPRLRQHGYDISDLAELINARQGEIGSLPRGELEPARGQELTAKLMAAGLPI